MVAIATESSPGTWSVVGHVRTRHGDLVPVYEPFAAALATSTNKTDAMTKIRRVLRSRGINPTEPSLKYYYDSARRFLRSQT